MPDKQSVNGRLDSWKEIAKYLDRDVRTVIRWEKKRKLPVHRLPGGQAVFAYIAELDEWLTGGTSEDASPSPAGLKKPLPDLQPASVQGKPEVSVPKRSLPRWFWAYAAMVGTVGAIVAILVGVSFSHRRAAAASASVSFRLVIGSIRFAPGSIQALDDAGGVMWTHELAKPIHPDVLKRKDRLDNLVRISDLFHDGGREALVTLPLQISPDPADAIVTEVDCFTSRGRLLWSYVPHEKLQFGDHELEGPWEVGDVFLTQGSEPAVWVALIHFRWGNSFVVKLDPQTGKETVRFVNTGIIYKLNEVRLAGKPYLLAGGFNNEYAAGMLAAIDEERPYAVSPQTAGTRHKCVSCSEGVPDYYFVFPRSEINRLRHSWEDSVRQIEVQGEHVEVEKAELGDPNSGVEWADVSTIYGFRADTTLLPVTLRFDSSYDMLHHDLQAKGQLDHPLLSCPERLHPQPVRIWTPARGWTEAPVRAPD